MNKPAFLLCVFAVMLVAGGCAHPGDGNAKKVKTDFTVGTTYLLKKWAFVWAGESSLINPEDLGFPPQTDALRAGPPRFRGAIGTGTRLRVAKLVWNSAPMMGNLTEVYAEVLDGPFKGQIFNIREISFANWTTGVTLRDPKMLEQESPLKDEVK